MTIPTPYDPNVSPELALYVERCGLPIRVIYTPYFEDWSVIGPTGFGDWLHSPAAATKAYTALRDRLMAERGMIVDREV